MPLGGASSGGPKPAELAVAVTSGRAAVPFSAQRAPRCLGMPGFPPPNQITYAHLSSDPIIGSPLRSESFNLKAYVANNPLRFIDPSGFQMCDELSRCGFGGAPNSSPGGGFEGAASLPTFSPYSPGYSEAKYTSGAASRGPAASGGEKALFVGVGAGAAIGIGAGATKLAVLCIGTGPGCAAVLAGLVVVGTGYAVYDLVWDGGAVEIVDAFSHFETRHDALVVGATLAGVGQLVAKPVTNVVSRRLAGGGFLTTYEEVAGSAATRGTGPVNAAGGYVESTVNAQGGQVITAVGEVEQADFAAIIDAAIAGGEEVYILTGVHGAVDGSMVRAPQFFAEDLAAWGGTAGVKVLNLLKLSPAQRTGLLRGPGTTVGAFCNSGICLAPYR